MHILLFHPVYLPPRNYGGVERVVLWLARGLLEYGHDVSIAALKGSQLPEGCRLVEVKQKKYNTEEFLKCLPKGIDRIHFMAPISEHLWKNLPFPALLTVHGNAKKGEIFPKNTVFLSQSHAATYGAQVFVYNGVDPAEFFFSASGKYRNSYLFFSKTQWSVKNLKGAFRYCQKAGVPLTIAGGHRPFSLRFQAFLTSKFRWIGPVSGLKKAELLSQAKALVFPVIWPEPFGLVVIEAFMSGTPVIASPYGSLRELIPQACGALAESEEQWIENLRKPWGTWSSEQCRLWALEKFHYHTMAAQYITLYKKIGGKDFLHESFPVSQGWKRLG